MMLRHPFICAILSTFQDERHLYVVMEFANGGDLFGRLREQGRFPNDHARFYSGEITLALAYIHFVQVVYRDVKPENCLLDGYGHVKLADFGFAKVVEPGTQTFTLCGTPEYLAPERVRNQGHGKAVDWWAFGVLLFEMLSGVPPFAAENAFDTYQLILKGKVEMPRHFDVKVKDLIGNLLVDAVLDRLGSDSKSGSEEVKRHRWYKGLDWDLLLNRSVEPPFAPPVKGPSDSCMFEEPSDSEEKIASVPRQKDQALFLEYTVEA